MKTPSEHFKAPVIGKVLTKELKLNGERNGETFTHVCEPAEYEVIHILEMNKGKAYVTNQWHAEHRKEALIIIDSLVESYFPQKDEK